MKTLNIKNLTLKNYGCFEEFILNFEKKDNSIYQWTVLLGNNNTGKTSVLKAIADLSPRLFITPSSKSEDEAKKYVPSAYYDEHTYGYLQDENSYVEAKLGNNSFWGYDKKNFKIQKGAWLEDFLIFGYGVSRYPATSSLGENKSSTCDTLFSNDVRLINLEEWLMQLDYASKNEQIAAHDRLNRIKDLICSNLFPEIKDFKFESSDKLHNYVLFKTEDGWFRYTQLGYGYQSMLSWIIDLCKKMFDAYPDMQNPLDGEAVVLIDEIDLHLHPKWQRQIISYLSNAFPNVQFIVTTHSPLVVQSIDDINLYVLCRKDDKIHITKPEQPNFNGWTIEEILRDTMGLESNVYSDRYNHLLEEFRLGLDNKDINRVEEAYKALEKILHVNNPMRRLLEIQKDLM